MINLELKTGNLVELTVEYTNNGVNHKKGDIGIITGFTSLFHVVTMQESGESLRLMDDEIVNVK